jgi:GNAT superfamily N-acetyltransferase
VTAQIRPYADADLAAMVGVRSRAAPEAATTVEQAAYRESLWDTSRYTRVRLVAERDDQVVGWGEVTHAPWRFHPRKYALRLYVEPTRQGQGIGSALHDRLLDELRERGALLARATVHETRPRAVEFFTRRGYAEVERFWPSHLDVARFDFARFATADERVAGQGIVLTTLAEERARDAGIVRPLYDLAFRSEFDEPTVDPATPVPFEEWLASEIDDPQVLPDAYFLARDGARLVGLSSLVRLAGQPEALDTGYTCVDPDYRGRGIAIALKLRAIAYARAHGYREIRTENHSLNVPMLRINEALGFARQPAEITFERPL